MKVFFLFILFSLALLIGAYLYRVLQGPTIFDRVLGLNGISTKAIILLVLIGVFFDRVDMFVDISTGYAIAESGRSTRRCEVFRTKRVTVVWNIFLFPSS